jgi:hypothetical protein
LLVRAAGSWYDEASILDVLRGPRGGVGLAFAGTTKSRMVAMFRLRLAGLLLTLAAPTLTGCRSAPPVAPSIPLHVDETAMKAEVLRHVPVGTPVEDAERIMSSSGFDCTYFSPGGDDPPLLFCDVYQKEDWLVSRRWMVSFYCNDGKVTRVDVSTGLIGP